MTPEKLLAQFAAGDRVYYTDAATGGKDFGIVSSVNAVCVFVRFDKHTEKFGWDGATSQACSPRDLTLCEKRQHDT